MKYLQIQNDGLLDFRLVALMGGTTKSKDKFKIGQFGTGLKYTLAFLFRNNLDFKVFIGEDEVKISTVIEHIKGEDFDIICINGERTSITTKMGEDWTAWMIVRELWCNALDEGGANRVITTDPAPTAGKTTFFVQIDSQIQDVLNNWSRYFIHDQEPICETEAFRLYPAGNHLCIYKQGVLVYESEVKKPGLFAYDILDGDINELREFRGNVSKVIAQSVALANAKSVEILLENITEDHYEANMDWNWFQTFNDNWRKVIGTAKIIHPEAMKSLQSRGITVEADKLITVPKALFKVLTNQFDGIGAVRVAGIIGEFYEAPSPECELQIKKGLAILETCGYEFHPELVFKYGFFEDKNTLAKIDIKAKVVYVSKAMVQRPLFDVVSMLIEENEHFNTGMPDLTRQFQQHFIDLYTRTLLAKNEVEL